MSQAAIFAAVLTGIIVESKELLEPDQTEILVDLAILYFNNVGNLSNTSFSRPEFVPTSAAISINCLLFASLGLSLISALVSVVALQWVGDYDAAITRGGSSSEDRAKRRQFRHDGVLNWKMGGIIATLPLLLYASVALFWAGATQWMWAIHPTVGQVLAGSGAVAILLYVLTTLFSAIFVSAPFHTPLSRGVYLLCQPVFSLFHYLSSVIPFGRILSWLAPISDKISSLSWRLRNRFVNQGFRSHITKIGNRVKAWLLPSDTAYDRENHVAKKDQSLGEQALCWLARQLPISVDSHRRLLLLLAELLNRSSLPTFSPRLSRAPWWQILDFLGMQYLQKLLDGPLSEDDEKGVSLVFQCSEIEEIKSSIHPIEKYGFDPSSALYEERHGFDLASLVELQWKISTSATASLLVGEEPHIQLQANTDSTDVGTIWERVNGVRDSLYRMLQDRVKLARSSSKPANNRTQVEILLDTLLQIECPSLINEGKIDALTSTNVQKAGWSLYPWDNFEPYLQPIAFSLRVHMLVNRDEDDVDNPGRIAGSLHRMAEAGSPPYIRIILLFATIRGLLRGRKTLRRMCVVVLSEQVLRGERGTEPPGI